jgi:glycosyltransferase involved in cell wall biosynthesis
MISIVIPVHNEEALLNSTAEGIVVEARELGWDFEAIFVENGSSDRTWELCQALAASIPEIRVWQEPVGDYGNAVRSGLRGAHGDTAVVFDCDLWDMSFASEAVTLLQMQPSMAVVVASKTLGASHDERSLLRKAGTKVFTVVVKLLVGLSVSDTHGMKAIALSRVEEHLQKCEFIGHVFDTELIVRCERAGFAIGELPCRVEEQRAARTGYLSRVPSALADMWRMRQMFRAEQRRAAHSIPGSQT